MLYSGSPNVIQLELICYTAGAQRALSREEINSGLDGSKRVGPIQYVCFSLFVDM